MADNVSITPGSGAVIATDEVTDGVLGTVQVQYLKIMDGTLNGTNKATVTSAGELKVNSGATSNFSATFPTVGTAIGAEYQTSPPTLTSGQMTPLQLDVNGNLKVNLSSQIAQATWSSATALNTVYNLTVNTSIVWNSLSGTINCTTTLTAGAVTFEESYDFGTTWVSIPASRLINPSTGVQLANPLTLAASTNFAWEVVCTSTNYVRVRLSTAIVGSATVTISTTQEAGANAVSVFQPVAGNLLCTASQGGAPWAMKPDGTVWGMNGTSANVAVTSGTVVAIDEASFTAGNSAFAPSGGFFQTTATNNALTTGQHGEWQMTAQRAGFVNIRDASGNQIGVTNSGFCIQGDITSGSTESGNPIKIGGQAKTTNPTAVSDGQRVQATFDKVGRLTTTGALRQLKGVQKTSITTASETTVITAGAAGIFQDVYAIVITNKSSTSVFVDFKDATAGTTRMTMAAPANDTRGFTVAVDSAMVQAVAANNWTATVSSAVTSIEITMLYTSNI